MDEGWIFSKEWLLPSEYGYEKQAMYEVSSVIDRVDPDYPRREDLLTVVAEACLNALEHGNHGDRRLPVRLLMQVSVNVFRFLIFDEGEGFQALPEAAATDRKWSENEPRGWGIFLIRSLADRMKYGERGGKFYIEVQFDR